MSCQSGDCPIEFVAIGSGCNQNVVQSYSCTTCTNKKFYVSTCINSWDVQNTQNDTNAMACVVTMRIEYAGKLFIKNGQVTKINTPLSILFIEWPQEGSSCSQLGIYTHETLWHPCTRPFLNPYIFCTPFSARFFISTSLIKINI